MWQVQFRCSRNSKLCCRAWMLKQHSLSLCCDSVEMDVFVPYRSLINGRKLGIGLTIWPKLVGHRCANFSPAARLGVAPANVWLVCGLWWAWDMGFLCLVLPQKATLFRVGHGGSVTDPRVVHSSLVPLSCVFGKSIMIWWRNLLPSCLALGSFPVTLESIWLNSPTAKSGIFVDSAVEAANKFRSDAELVAYLGAGISHGKVKWVSKISYPPWNWHQKHLKKDGWFRWISFSEFAFFPGRAVCFRECIYIYI